MFMYDDYAELKFCSVSIVLEWSCELCFQSCEQLDNRNNYSKPHLFTFECLKQYWSPWRTTGHTLRSQTFSSFPQDNEFRKAVNLTLLISGGGSVYPENEIMQSLATSQNGPNSSVPQSDYSPSPCFLLCAHSGKDQINPPADRQFPGLQELIVDLTTDG